MADVQTQATKKKKAAKYTCCVPKKYCSGGDLEKKGKFKFHATPEEVLKCKQRYLRLMGFEQISSREFVNPDNGYIRVLTKATKAQRAKSGKAERYMKNRGQYKVAAW